MTTAVAQRPAPLGRKGHPSDAEWRRVWGDYERIVPRAAMDRVIEGALERIESARQTFGPKTGVAWSGGKDSVVIHHLAGRLGITDGVYVAPDPVLDFTDFLAWVKQHQPEGVETFYPGMTIDWLVRNPTYLFPDRFGPGDPRTAAGVNAWNRFKWRTQRQYVRNRGLAFLLLGRRTIDGNVVGKSGVNRARDGFVAVNPIFDWSHEQTIAYIRYHGLPLAPNYHLPGGYAKGPRAWAMTTLDHVLAREPAIYERHRGWIDAALRQTGGGDSFPTVSCGARVPMTDCDTGVSPVHPGGMAGRSLTSRRGRRS